MSKKFEIILDVCDDYNGKVAEVKENRPMSVSISQDCTEKDILSKELSGEDRNKVISLELLKQQMILDWGEEVYAKSKKRIRINAVDVSFVLVLLSTGMLFTLAILVSMVSSITVLLTTLFTIIYGSILMIMVKRYGLVKRTYDAYVSSINEVIGYPSNNKKYSVRFDSRMLKVIKGYYPEFEARANEILNEEFIKYRVVPIDLANKVLKSVKDDDFIDRVRRFYV